MIYRIDCKTVELASSSLPLQWSWFSSRQRSLSCDWQINFALFGRGSRCFVNFFLWDIWFQQLLLRLLHVRKISIKSRRRVFWEYYSRNLSTSPTRQPKQRRWPSWTTKYLQYHVVQYKAKGLTASHWVEHHQQQHQHWHQPIAGVVRIQQDLSRCVHDNPEFVPPRFACVILAL